MGALNEAAHSPSRPDEEKINQFIKNICGLTLDEIRAKDVGADMFEDSQHRPVRVSTIYLWARLAIHERECWETMVFWGDIEREPDQERYWTREEAVAGHARWVARVEAEQ